jgi:diguanylate cyclase (GGDEF)-like protein
MGGVARAGLLVWLRLGVAGLVLGFLGVMALDIAGLTAAMDERWRQRGAAAVERGLFVLGEAAVARQLVVANGPDMHRRVQHHQAHGGGGPAGIGPDFWPRVPLEPGETALVVAPDGRSILGHHGGHHAGLTVPDSFQPVLAKLQRSFTSLREGAEPERLFAGVYAHGVVLAEGRPALLTAVAIAPGLVAAGEGTRGGTPATLVTLIPFGPEVARRLAEIADVASVQWLPPGAALPAGRDALALGPALGSLAWPAEQPGAAVFARVLPLVAASVLLVLLHGLATHRRLRLAAEVVLNREATARQLALVDTATGLANRRWFEAEFAEAAAVRPATGFAVVLIDLDYFKAVNDTLGHAAGDAVLRAVAERLRAMPDGVRLAARLGGDEFAVITTTLPGRDALGAFCEALRGAVMQPLVVEGQSLDVSASIGAALWPDDGASLPDLLAAADMALYRAKREGRGRARVYDAGTDLAAALRAAGAGAASPLPAREHRVAR